MSYACRCKVCSKQLSKYKCPSCRIKYCSVSCYKIHKQLCKEQEAKKSPEQRDSHQNNKTIVKKEVIVDSEDHVPECSLARLQTSEQLKQQLCNPHLRDLITSLDSTHSVQEFMDKCMQEPIFTEFTDLCLKVLEGEEDSVPGDVELF